ncbi:MAG: permease-like cell division protein FtsX [Muribaculum sp.]|nr:permease-like cell division protein FtsX [Muribaculum sp.]
MAHNRTTRRISTLGSRFTSLISVCLVLFLLGIGAMAGMMGRSLVGEIRRNVGFVVKLERECPDNIRRSVERILAAHPAVVNVEYLSADSILAIESEYMGENIAANLDDNPFHPEFSVSLTPGATAPDSVNTLSSYFSSIVGVDEVISENEVVSGIDRALGRTGSIAIIAAAIVLIISIALINNTISLTIYSRRNIIHTMKLVGATSGFIRRPFVVASAVNGAIAGVIASVILIIVRAYASTFDSLVESSLNTVFMSVLCLALILIGALLCVATATFALNRHLNSSYEDLFLK